MQAFETLFPDVATREYRALELQGQHFFLQEYYCEIPRCDCKRAVLIAHHLDARAPVATLAYVVKPGTPQVMLHEEGPQSALSNPMVRVVQRALAEDSEFREMLHTHYAAYRRVVDGPKKPTRSVELERVIAKASGTGSKAQQRFRKLLEKVDRLRQRLGVWKQQRGDIDREIALYRAVHDRHARLGHQLVVALDRAYADGKFSKAERNKLTALIGDLAEMLIAQGGGDELKEIYSRHTQRDFDAEAAAAEANNVEMMRGIIEDELGIEVDDEDAGSVEQLRAAVRAQIDAREEAEAARKARRKKTAKQAAAEARRDDEKKSADKAVQDIYRTLARALHPDHEQDADERARKTRLMSEVNVAYEAKDLLRLLALQLELERVDESRVETLAEERLVHFARILDEQARQLDAELAGLEMPYRMELGLMPSAVVTPERVIVRIRADASALEIQIERAKRDLVTFLDPALLKQWLRAQARRR